MLSKLKFLDLSGNPLQNLPPDVFRDVPVNQIKFIEFLTKKKRNIINENIDPLTHISFDRIHILVCYYSIYHEELTQILIFFSFLLLFFFADLGTNSKQLTELRCRNCQLTKINPQLYNLLPQLTTLDLGRNEVQTKTNKITLIN